MKEKELKIMNNIPDKNIFQPGIDSFKKDEYMERLRKTCKRYMINWYNIFEHTWKNIIRIKQYNNKIEISPRKLGFSILNLTIDSNDYFAITQMLEEVARGADETIMTYVFSLLIGSSESIIKENSEFAKYTDINTDLIDDNSRKVYEDDNSIKDFPLTGENIDSAIEQYLSENRNKYLIIPIELENTFLEIKDTAKSKYVNSGHVLPIVVDSLYLGDHKENWYLIEDPIQCDGINLTFKDDIETPSISINTDTKGDGIAMLVTISHSYTGEVVNHKSLFAALN